MSENYGNRPPQDGQWDAVGNPQTGPAFNAQNQHGQQGYGQQAYPPVGQPGGYPPQYGGGYGQEPPKGKGPLVAWTTLGILVVLGIVVAILFGTGVLGGDDEDDAATTGTETVNADGKPSREAVRDGLETIFTEQFAAMGLTEEQVEASGLDLVIDDYYICVVDGMYDDASAEALQILADGDPNAPLFGADYELLTSVSNSCLETELEPAMGG